MLVLSKQQYNSNIKIENKVFAKLIKVCACNPFRCHFNLHKQR